MDGWKRVRGSLPQEYDTTSSEVYNYARRNIEQVKEDGATIYEYDELKVRKEDWGIFMETVTNSQDIADNREGIMETYEETESNSSDIADLRAAIMEIYETIE